MCVFQLWLTECYTLWFLNEIAEFISLSGSLGISVDVTFRERLIHSQVTQNVRDSRKLSQ